MAKEACLIFFRFGNDISLVYSSVQFYRRLQWFFCINKVNFLYCLNKISFTHIYRFSYRLQLLGEKTDKMKHGHFNSALKSSEGDLKWKKDESSANIPWFGRPWQRGHYFPFDLAEFEITRLNWISNIFYFNTIFSNIPILPAIVHIEFTYLITLATYTYNFQST